MKPSIIVYGVPNGETRFAERIAKFYGLEIAKKEFRGDSGIFTYDWIYFTREKVAPKGLYTPHAKSFREVAEEINAVIPYTAFVRGEPTIVGEYEVKFAPHEPAYRRWWHGDGWSYAMLNEHTQTKKDFNASCRQDYSWRPWWRGLSEEPINTDE